MLEIDVEKIIPVTKARAKIASVVDDVCRGNLYVLTRNGKPAALVVPVAMMGELKSQLNQSKQKSREVVEVKVKEPKTQEPQYQSKARYGARHENTRTPVPEQSPVESQSCSTGQSSVQGRALKQENAGVEKMKTMEVKDKKDFDRGIEEDQYLNKINLDEVDQAIEEYDKQNTDVAKTQL